MFCGQCGNQIADNAAFCGHCGNKIGIGRQLATEPAPVAVQTAPMVEPPSEPPAANWGNQAARNNIGQGETKKTVAAETPPPAQKKRFPAKKIAIVAVSIGVVCVAVFALLLRGFFDEPRQGSLAEEIVLSANQLTLEVDGHYSLQASVKPDNVANPTVRWLSSDASVVAVDDSGNITAVSVGAAVIITVLDDVSARCEVTVIPKLIAAEEVVFSQGEYTIEVGAQYRLEITINPADATDKTVQWFSGDPSVATVDHEGNITGTGAGRAVITATCGNVSAEAGVTVNQPAAAAAPARPVQRQEQEQEQEQEIAVSEITISRESMILEVGGQVGLTATVKPDDATDKTLQWSSSDSSVVRVDRFGNVTAVGIGMAIITVRSGNVSAACAITVG